MVTHNPNLTSYASRVINMLDGKIASDTSDAPDPTIPKKSVKVPLNHHTTKRSKEKPAKTPRKKMKKAAK
jgi:hypothetical protein